MHNISGGFSLFQKGIIEVDDDMFVMEPSDKENEDHSHVAYKMKRKPMKFEDGKGKLHQPGYIVYNHATCC